MSHAQVMERFSVLLTRSEHSYVTTLGFAEQPPHNRRILEGFVRLDDKMFQYIHKHVKADAVRAGPRQSSTLGNKNTTSPLQTNHVCRDLCPEVLELRLTKSMVGDHQSCSIFVMKFVS